MHTEGVHIRHAENGEVCIENFIIDGYDESTKTVYEYHSCFWHKQFCHVGYNANVYKILVPMLFRLQIVNGSESKDQYSREQNPVAVTTTTMQDIIDDIISKKMFGFVQVDIHVPDHLIDKFSEFPPLFKNTEIQIGDIGDHMQEFCRKTTRNVGVKRSLISSMHAQGILLITTLLKKYLEMGLVVTNIETVIVYNGKEVFQWFMKEVCQDRRRADLGGVELEMKGEASKLKGNCGYGRTLMDKSKHTQLSFTKEKCLTNHVNNPFFKHCEELNGNFYEVEKRKK